MDKELQEAIVKVMRFEMIKNLVDITAKLKVLGVKGLDIDKWTITISQDLFLQMFPNVEGWEHQTDGVTFVAQNEKN